MSHIMLPAVVAFSVVTLVLLFLWARSRHVEHIRATIGQNWAVAPAGPPNYRSLPTDQERVMVIADATATSARVVGTPDAAVAGAMTSHRRHTGFAAASSDAVLSSIPAWHELSQFDWNVLDGVQLSAAADLDLSSYTDLKGYLNQHYFEVGEPEGFFTRLTGYVGEATAGRSFEAAGSDVVFPDAPNEPGIDMWVDGDPVQIKIGGAADTFNAHFERNPDIPVFTGADNLDVVPDGLDVSIMAGLDAEHIRYTTEQGLDAIGSDFGAGGAAIPLITVIRSSMREIELLDGGDTDLLTAAKNVGLDATGVAAGGWAGAKAGALLGSMFGPVGTVVGGMLGGVGGAIAGRAIANEMKIEPFQQAFASYQSTLSHAKEAMRAKEVEVHRELQMVVNAEQQAFESAMGPFLDELVNRMDARRQRTVRSAVAFLRAFPKVLRRVLDDLSQRRDAHLASLPTSRPILRLLWPSRGDIEYDMVAAAYERRESEMKAVLVSFDTLASRTPVAVPADEAIRRIVSFFRDHPFVSRDFDHLCRQLRHTVNTGSAWEIQAKASVAHFAEQCRRKHLKNVERRIVYLMRDASVVAAQHGKSVSAAKSRVLAEGKKIGLQPNGEQKDRARD